MILSNMSAYIFSEPMTTTHRFQLELGLIELFKEPAVVHGLVEYNLLQPNG